MFGNNAVIYCNASGVPTPKVMWRSEKEDLRFNSSKYTVYPYALEIRQIEYADLGKYYCYAKNGIGRTASITVTLSRGCM